MAPNTESQSQPAKQKSKSPPAAPTARQQDVIEDAKSESLKPVFPLLRIRYVSPISLSPTYVRNESFPQIAESSLVEDAELAQWLEFTADVALRKNLTDDQAMVYLLFLNKTLTGRAFLTGPRSTSADTTLHAALRDILVSLKHSIIQVLP